MEFIAYITKGTQPIAAKEIKEKIPGSKIKETSPKYIIFQGKDNLQQLLDLKTIDDIQKLLKHKKYKEKPGTKQIQKEFPLEQFKKTFNYINNFRELENTFSITSSRYKNKEINLEKLEEKISVKIEKNTQLKYTDKKHDNYDVRIHIEQKNLLISTRLRRKPLYYRKYRERSQKASLRPTIAASIIYLLNPENGEIVDNLCGAGTILCEAYQQGLTPYGGDQKTESVEKTRKNLSNLSDKLQKNVKQLNAKQTEWSKNRFDYAVSNYPWGKQINLNEKRLYRDTLKEYKRILKPEAAIALIGTNKELAEKHLKENWSQHQIKTIKIGFQGQEPYITVASPPKKDLNLANIETR